MRSRRAAEREPRSDVIRCFVAIDLSVEIRAAIAAVIAALREHGGDVRWVEAGNLHMTLKFLGHLSQAEVAAVCAALTHAARRLSPFTVHATGLGRFPSSGRARVIWAGLDAPDLSSLVDGVDGALAAVGFRGEPRAFTPHVTIGRVRSGRGWSELAQPVAAHGDVEFGVSLVDEIVLYRSDLSSQGARYTAIDRWPLGAAERTAGR
jgi:2'-5' RNA ligase